MYNVQSSGLHRALLRSQNSKLYYLSFEPLMLRKSEYKALKAGDLLSLGKELPQPYIYRKGNIVGQADLGQIDGNTAAIVSAKEHISNLGKPEAKHILLECRIAVLSKNTFVVGKLALLPKDSLSHIVLFVKQKPIAAASLMQNKEGYFLQIEEQY